MYEQNLKTMNNLVNEMYYRSNIPHVISFPESLIIGISTRCNYKCMMCTEWQLDPVDVSEKILAEIRPILPFLKRVHISGGEPLMYGGLWDFIAECRAADTVVTMVSNGSLLTDANIERLLDSGVQMIKISLDAATQQTYSTIRQGNLFKVLGNVAKLTKAKIARRARFPEIEFGFVAMRNNIQELSKTVVLAHELGVKQVRAAHAFTHHIEGLDAQALKHTPEISDTEMIKASRIAQELGVILKIPPLFNPATATSEQTSQDATPKLTTMERSTCADPWRTLFVYAHGMVGLCCLGAQGDFGNLETQTFQEVWNHPNRMNVRQKINTNSPPAACMSCTVFPQMTRPKKVKKDIAAAV